MEEFKEYVERFIEWFLVFIKSRWIKTFLFLMLLIGFGISTYYSIMGTMVSPSWTNAGVTEVYGHRDWAIPALIISIFGFIWVLIIISNDPSKHKRKPFRKFYKAWKLWYWMPTIFSFMILELLLRLVIIIAHGRYVPDEDAVGYVNNNDKKKHSYSISVIYKQWKLWYWIPSLGLAIIFEYMTVLTRKIQNNKLYYWDLILFIVIILALSMSLGVISFEVRTATIRKY